VEEGNYTERDGGEDPENGDLQGRQLRHMNLNRDLKGN